MYVRDCMRAYSVLRLIVNSKIFVDVLRDEIFVTQKKIIFFRPPKSQKICQLKWKQYNHNETLCLKTIRCTTTLVAYIVKMIIRC